MKIKVLKSKAKNVPVKKSLIGHGGIIKLPQNLLDQINIVEHEMVTVINEMTGRKGDLFIEVAQEVAVPFTIGGAGDRISIISTGSATVDEKIKEPIIYESTENNDY